MILHSVHHLQHINVAQLRLKELIKHIYCSINYTTFPTPCMYIITLGKCCVK